MQLDAPQRSPRAGPTEVVRVLVVDRDRERAADLAAALVLEGHDVQLAHGADEAVAQCRRHAPVLWLIDAGLATANGGDLIARLRGEQRDAICVVLAAEAERSAAMDALANGAYDTLRKPLDRRELRALLARCGEVRSLRQERERSLREHEDRLRSLTDGLPVAIFEIDADETFRFVNATCSRWADKPIEAVVGRKAEKVLGDDYPSLKHHIDRALAGHSESFEAAVTIAGEERTFRITCVPRADPSGARAGFFGMAEDVTERRNTDTLLANAAALAKVGHFAWDLVEDRFIHFSEVYARIHGVSVEDYLASTGDMAKDAHWIHPEDRARYLAAAKRSLQSFEPLEIEYRIVRKDGEIRHIYEREYEMLVRNGVPIRSQGIIQDITELRRVEETVRNRDAWLRAILAESPAHIVIKNRDGRILAASRNIAEYVGRRQEDCIGRRTDDFLRPEIAAIYMAADRRVIETGEALQQEVTEEHDGKLEHYLNAKFPLTDDDGRIVGVCSLTSDITPFKEVQARLNQAQKMEAVGQLTGGVAHDFNNLLAVVLGNLELAEEQLDAAHPCHELVQGALAAGRRGAALTQRLLAFSRRQALQPAVLDINETVAGMISLLRRTLGERIELLVRPAEGLWTCTADAVQLETALLNLAINSRDAMPRGGQLVLETANIVLDEAYAAGHAEVEPGDYAMLAVSDSGAGIAPEVIGRVFDPFFSTKGLGERSGLGLSMVFGFAKQSGGHVTIESRLAEGTTVKLYLPRSRDRQPVPAPSDSLSEAIGGSEAVLVVEDDPALRALTTTLIGELGYRVTGAADGTEALARLSETPGFDLMLTDVVLPGGIDGRELADLARRRSPRLRVVLMSGYGDWSVPGAASQESAALLLRKPFGRQALARAIREALES